METTSHQIHVPNTLDVMAVERELAELWKQTAGFDHTDGDEVVMRARAADLMVFITDESALEKTHQTISELSAAHPCRALVMVADRAGAARDIEMHITAFCQTEARSGKKQLCCEEVTLSARGHFTAELPSAAVPLLVPDLPVFLWWRDELNLNEKLLQSLTRAADRLVIDSADLRNPQTDLRAIAQLFESEGEAAIAVSDLNWARLTSWRSLLANFYDVREYRPILDSINNVQIEYVGSGQDETIVPQAFLISGWLASRLGWDIAGKAEQIERDSYFEFRQDNRRITLGLKRVERPSMKPGRLTQIQLQTTEKDIASFLVLRSEDGLHLETHARMARRSLPGRTLPVRNRSTAQLLAREMEILCHDKIYEDALNLALQMIAALER